MLSRLAGWAIYSKSPELSVLPLRHRAKAQHVVVAVRDSSPEKSAAAEAKVAWPHSGTSAVGVNQRSLKVSQELNKSWLSLPSGSNWVMQQWQQH